MAPAREAARGHAHLRYAAVAAEAGRGLPQQEGLPEEIREAAHGAPKKNREPPHLDDMAVAREICRSLDVLSRETGESREAWRTKIFGASPPPKRQVSVTMPVASAPFAVSETCRQAVMSVDTLPGGPQAPRDVDRARLEETLRGRLRRARM